MPAVWMQVPRSAVFTEGAEATTVQASAPVRPLATLVGRRSGGLGSGATATGGRGVRGPPLAG